LTEPKTAQALTQRGFDVEGDRIAANPELAEIQTRTTPMWLGERV